MKISKPGLYENIPLEIYHDEPCAEPSISSSGLRLLATECPAKYWWQSPLNPNRSPRETTPALNFGSAQDTLMFRGRSGFNEACYVLPENYDGRLKKWAATKEGKETQIAAGKIILTHAEQERAFAMKAALDAHPYAANAFLDGRPEVTLVWRDEMTDVLLRARPDWLPNQARHIPDYKTSLSARPSEFMRAIWNYQYHMQAALYLDGIEAVTGEKWESFYFVVQEKEPPYVVSCVALTPTALTWGQVVNRKTIETFARCLESNHWPGYDEHVTEVELPRYAEMELQRRHERGEFSTGGPAK